MTAYEYWLNIYKNIFRKFFLQIVDPTLKYKGVCFELKLIRHNWNGCMMRYCIIYAPKVSLASFL